MVNWMVPTGPMSQKPGLGQQLATNAADKIATDQIAKLGLQAAGTAAAGPLGGAIASSAGELAGPLAGQLVGSLFKKGGPVYKQDGGLTEQASNIFQEYGGSFTPEQWAEFVGRLKGLQLPGTPPKEVPEDLKAAPVEEVVKPEVVSPRSKASAQWNIPLGEALGGEWSTSGHYADMDTGKDPWGAMIKGTWKFNEGGGVPGETSTKDKTIWSTIADKVTKDFKKRKSLFGKGKLPEYKAIGGLTTGPLGMSDMMEAGKPKSVSKVKMKKNNGDQSEEVELNYHPPLNPKGE